ERTDDSTIWKNPELPLAVRIADLIDKMTLEEKISQLTADSPAIERFGIEPYKLGGECLHGICNSGRATQFPMPIGMASSFDRKLLQKVADAVSDEARAKSNSPAWGPEPRMPLLFYTPVINIVRDPRWGRAQETYGEDPYLSGELGSAYVKGLQGDHPKYLKVAACAKHLAVQSGPENLRTSFDAVVSKKDLFETYLPAFEALVKVNVATVMATYNRVNGEHCCGSKFLLKEFLRGRLGFKGQVVSDGGALASVHGGHKVTANALETAALCLRTGCDHEIGRNAYPLVGEAIEKGMLDEADVDLALSRILKVRFQVGEFDSPELNPYTEIKENVIQCSKHIKLARKTACKSMVLLKNNGILPLREKDQPILVTGPTAGDLQVLLGNFYRGVSGDLRTIVEGIVANSPEGVTITYQPGCFLTHDNLFDSHWTAGIAKWSEVVVVVLGYSPLMEGEQGECIGSVAGGDKAGIDIPECQMKFLREMKAEGKPIVAVVTCGSPIALQEVHELADAVLLAWYPGEQGGMAVGEILFGKESPSGKLPVTFPKSLDQVPHFEDYTLTGRTYRYMNDEPMYPFGFGLSYTSFEYTAPGISRKRVVAGRSLKVKVSVTNTGQQTSDEVVQLYLKKHDSALVVPNYSLKDFVKITLAPGKTKKLSFTITPEMMSLIDMEGDSIHEPGMFSVYVGGSLPDARSAALGAAKPVELKFELI
ncbi:MAG TPA: glycoside hydrolase family 3 protein, partial [Phycisphaerae bacterium]|nr:glycoside hydrolase family 3 protein [Phycisphaerae bacterium]